MRGRPPPPRRPMKPRQRTLTFWVVVVLATALFAKMANQDMPRSTEIKYGEFMDAVGEGRVRDVVVVMGANRIEGSFHQDAALGGRTAFHLTGPTGEAMVKRLEEGGIVPSYKEKERAALWTSLFLSWGPMIFLIAVFWFFLRQVQFGSGKAMSFGKSKAKMLTANDKKKVTFRDVSGVEEAKEELKEVVDFLRAPKKYTALGGRIPKGVILIGPPGTGKTLLARAVAGEADVPFFSISGSDFVEMFVGVGASRVRDLFEQGKKHAPCIVFIDEIDAVGRHRGVGIGGGHDEREQTLNQLLVEMDGFQANDGVILIAATNRIDVLDRALMRPGRFDRRVTVGVPDIRGRLGILKVHTASTPVDKDVDLEVIAKGTPGFTGADLANLVNEAALNAARTDKRRLAMDDFEMAKDKVLMGPERKSMVISEKEKRVTAFHEAGHTLVGINLPHADPIHKVSIMPRGGALGVTQTLPNEDTHNLTKERAENLISFLMGGRCAEELVFGQITSGASNDIERATALARNMVCLWGMSERMGPLNYHRTGGPFPGADPGDQSDYSEQTAQQIDEELRAIIRRNHDQAMGILTANRDALTRLAQGLIVWETLDFEQVQDLIADRDIGVPLVKKPARKGRRTAAKDGTAKGRAPRKRAPAPSGGPSGGGSGGGGLPEPAAT